MAPKKAPGFLFRLVLFLTAVVMVLAAVAAVVYRDRLNFDSFKRWYTYRSLLRDDSGQAESFRYDGGLDDTFAVLDGDLLVCSRNALSLYSGSGTQYISLSVSMDSPVVNANGTRAVVYDAGGGSLYVLGGREVLWSTDELDSILSARLNRTGQLTVVTQAGGYRGQVTVYDEGYEPVVSVNLSSAFVMDAALSDDGRTLAIVTIGQDGGSFATNLEFYTLNYAGGDFSPDLTCPLGADVVLEAEHTTSALWAVTDRGLSVTAHDGTTHSADWGGRHLRRYDLRGDGFAAVLLGKYRAGSQSELWLVDGDAGTRTLELDEQVLSLSAAGHYVAVLTGDRLDIYTDRLELYSTLEGTQGARNVLLMPDGSAILVSAEGAGFYIP